MKTLLTKITIATVAGAALSLGVMDVNPAQADTVIDTTPSWDGTSEITIFGEPDTATYGQTFTVGSDNILNDFTFFLNDFSDPDAIDFAAYVMAWDGTKATGSILYQSGPQSTTGASGMEQFTFNTGGISLTSGQKYVAFLSASNFFDGIDGLGSMGLPFSDVYAGGDFVYYNNGSDFSALTTNGWDCTECGFGDAAFKATFTSAQSVPEPASVLGLLTVSALGTAAKFKGNKKEKAE
ncbi:MAG TPA: PEP-CTERM sorting domain-containing protein [Cyanobacteria bacterium UBA12227]|nr:PEP-CTERM sorting domain-containing protein [Cyanobacteria bacterium UBA12227]HAX88500.1 PEP-CTERM sorting domain-containing protein [Cyanobacteria bacterium UBA11370]HBY77275.1 PEP-CTERM sorting domain-containing protein [Cyanobacteria bacterium UBA11148]